MVLIIAKSGVWEVSISSMQYLTDIVLNQQIGSTLVFEETQHIWLTLNVQFNQ